VEAENQRELANLEEPLKRYLYISICGWSSLTVCCTVVVDANWRHQMTMTLLILWSCLLLN